MCDTLNVINGGCVPHGDTVGEFMLINKFSYIFGSPDRGDIIIFKPDHAEDHYIKRIIAIPGDKVEIKKDKFVYVTPGSGDRAGEEIKINETYLNEINYGNTRVARENQRVFNVPEGGYFVMGDNRAHSSDSRHCFQYSTSGCSQHPEYAFITKDEMDGKGLATIWPLNNMKFIKGFDYGF